MLCKVLPSATADLAHLGIDPLPLQQLPSPSLYVASAFAAELLADLVALQTLATLVHVAGIVGVDDEAPDCELVRLAAFHLHCLVLDGVYRCDTEGEPVSVEVSAPTDEALQPVLHKIITRLMKLLTGKRVLVEEQGQTYVVDDNSDSDEARTVRPLQAAACTYRIAFGPRAGQKVLTLQGATTRDADFKPSLCANIQGPSLHAAARCCADDRQPLEQLCRYITRPALANERVQTNVAGQVVRKLKTPGATAPRPSWSRRWSSCSGWQRWCPDRGCT